VKGCPYGGRHWWYQTGRISELVQAVNTKPLGICRGFSAVLCLNFGSPIFRERGAAIVVGVSGVGQDASELLQAVYTKP